MNDQNSYQNSNEDKEFDRLLSQIPTKAAPNNFVEMTKIRFNRAKRSRYRLYIGLCCIGIFAISSPMLWLIAINYKSVFIGGLLLIGKLSTIVSTLANLLGKLPPINGITTVFAWIMVAFCMSIIAAIAKKSTNLK